MILLLAITKELICKFHLLFVDLKDILSLLDCHKSFYLLWFVKYYFLKPKLYRNLDKRTDEYSLFWLDGHSSIHLQLKPCFKSVGARQITF